MSATPYFDSDFPVPAKGAPVTIYVKEDMMPGVRKVEASRAAWGTTRYAQYDAAVVVRAIPKGMRKSRAWVEGYNPTVIILDGWGHPDPDGIWDASTTTTRGDVTTTRGRHGAASGAWMADLGAKIDTYCAATGAKKLADYRGHDTRTRFPR